MAHCCGEDDSGGDSGGDSEDAPVPSSGACYAARSVSFKANTVGSHFYLSRKSTPI
jgi:hypothetical protein